MMLKLRGSGVRCETPFRQRGGIEPIAIAPDEQDLVSSMHLAGGFVWLDHDVMRMSVDVSIR